MKEWLEEQESRAIGDPELNLDFNLIELLQWIIGRVGQNLRSVNLSEWKKSFKILL